MAIGIDYPLPAVSSCANLVPGDGRFYAWGICGATEGITGATVAWTENSQTQTKSPTWSEMGSGKWAFRFEGVKADGTTEITLTVNGMAPDPQGGMQPIQISETRKFRCTGHTRVRPKKRRKKCRDRTVIIIRGGRVELRE